MTIATHLRRLVAHGRAPVEFKQGSYRLRLMPGVGRIPDVSFSIWETENDHQWEPILTGWVRGNEVIVATWSAPGTPDNVESMVRFILAGKRQIVDTIEVQPLEREYSTRELSVAASSSRS